jgi:hypothetical protein
MILHKKADKMSQKSTSEATWLLCSGQKCRKLVPNLGFCGFGQKSDFRQQF